MFRAAAIKIIASLLGRKRKTDRTTVAGGTVDAREQFHRPPALLAGDQRRPVVEDGMQEIINLQTMVILDRVDGVEMRGVFLPPLGQQFFLARNGPQVVQRAVR